MYKPYKNVIGRPFKMLDTLIGVYGDPETWVFSTLPKECADELVLVYEVKQGKFSDGREVRQRMWLHDILDDNNILYQVVIKGFWASRKRFAETQWIMVTKADEGEARRLIDEFNDPDNVVEGSEDDVDEDDKVTFNGIIGTPQRRCHSCGKVIDFDYVKCPHCKALVQ